MTSPSAALPADTDSANSTLPTTSIRITSPSLLLALRAAWIVLVGYEIVLIGIKIPINASPLLFKNGGGYEQLAALGLAQAFIFLALSLGIVSFVAAMGLATILFWRTRNDFRAMFFSFVILAFGSTLLSTPAGLLPPLLVRPAAFLSSVSLLAIIYLFPDVRFKPSILRYWFGLVSLSLLVSYLQADLFDGIAVYLFFPAVLIGVGNFIWRYRQASPLQRQQIKWLVPVFIAIALLIITWMLVFILLPTDLSLLVQNFLALAAGLIFIALPLAIGLAVLRYRLYEVDLIINRSLVYGAVTVLLALVFMGIIGLASAVTQGTGAGIGALVATGAAGLLFNPARKAAQHFVDHRLYGLRYDLNELAAAQQKPEIKNPGIYTGRTFGAYEVLGVLGKGGMGEVYKGYGSGQTVAIKVLPEDLAKQDDLRKRFQREVETLSSLDHPNIVRLYGSGVTDDQVHYLTMELIDGEELADLIKHGGAVTDFEALHDWVQSIASALDYIHTRGLVHRDLKPSNIMLRKTADGETLEAVLMDFGIARIDSAGTRLTGSGAIGTIDYMAPEQILAAGEVDGRADVYALGVVVYELLTGTRPFKGGAAQVMFAHLQQPAPDPRDLNPEVSRSVAKAVLKALEKKPDERFHAASDFATALNSER